MKTAAREVEVTIRAVVRTAAELQSLYRRPWFVGQRQRRRQWPAVVIQVRPTSGGRPTR